MYTLPFFRKILNLNWKKVTIAGIKDENKKLIFEIKGKYGNIICPHCGFNTNKRQDKKLHKQKQRIKHMPYGGDKIIELELHKRYFRCTNCETRFYEKFDFESPFGMYTTHFEKYIQWNWGHVSGNKLAELYQSSNSVVHSILERIDVDLINEKGIEIIKNLDEVYLGVDEHSFSGHDMVLVITELKTKQVIAILDGITKVKLDEWIWKTLPLKFHKKIKGYATDMNKGYAKSLAEICGNPIASVDKYHLFQEANRVVDDVRQIAIWSIAMKFIKVEDITKLGKKIGKNITKKDLDKLRKDTNNETMKKYKNKTEQKLKTKNINPKDLINSKGEIIEYKEITVDHFVEKGYRKLFFFREKNLSGIQKLRINQIMQEFDYLGFIKEVWIMKEDFFDAMDELDLSRIKEIRDECLGSEHYRIKQFGRTLKKWMKGIEGFCNNSTYDFKFTNALTEGINNLCKVAKRVSHGFRYKEMYIKKLVARFCLNELKI